jgi:hypothetical protein
MQTDTAVPAILEIPATLVILAGVVVGAAGVLLLGKEVLPVVLAAVPQVQVEILETLAIREMPPVFWVKIFPEGLPVLVVRVEVAALMVTLVLLEIRESPVIVALAVLGAVGEAGLQVVVAAEMLLAPPITAREVVVGAVEG